MSIRGTLKTLGEEGREVVLRGDRIDRMFDYLPYDRVPGQWQGVRFYASSYNNHLAFTDIHSAYHGVVADSSDVELQKLTLDHSTIHNCQGYGLHATHAKLTLLNSQITNTLESCLRIDGGNATLNQCTLAQFYPFDARRGAALQFTSTQAPLVNLSVSNTLVTGYADDVLMGEAGDTAVAFQYLFDHCILRTPKVTTADSVRFTQVVFEDVADTTHCGDKHFANIDTDNLIYNFELSSLSSAIGKANPQTALPTDRKGRKRDDKPDVGAFEWIEPKTE